MRATRSLFSLLAVTLCFTRLALAQIINVDNTTSTPIPGAGHDYIHLLSETVNPANGSVSLRIQIPMPKGRGISIPFSFGYDSNGVHHLEPTSNLSFGTAYWAPNSSYLGQGGWTYSVPMASASNWTVKGGNYPTYFDCGTFSNYMFTDPSGGQHALSLGTQFSGGAGTCPGSGFSNSQGGDAAVRATLPNTHPDNYNPDATPAFPVTVYTDNGTVYTFPFPPHFLSGQVYVGFPNSIEDRNGNLISITDNNNGSFVYRDSAGRSVISSNGFGPSGTTNTVSVSGGTYQVTWKTISANFSTPSTWVGPSPGPNGAADQCSPIPQANDTETVVSQIVLPNGKKFQFYYGTDNPDPNFQNPYGLLSEIDYPTGGWVKYTWKLSDTMNELANYPGEHTVACPDSISGCPAPVPDGCQYQYKTAVVASRSVGFGGSSAPALVQTFTYTTAWSSGGTTWTTKSTNLTTTDNVLAKSSLTAFTFQPITASTNNSFGFTSFSGQIPLESQIKYYDWGNTTTPIRTVNKTWQDVYHIASQQTVLDGGSSSKTTYTYVTSGSFLQPHEVDDYDFGASSPSRKAITNYQNFTGTPGKISAAPCQVIIQDGNSNTVAETDYLYDGGTTVCGSSGTPSVTLVSNLPAGTHDETLFSSTSATPRGNVTSVTRKCLQSCSNSVASFAYDETGQVLSMTDPCGNATCSDMPSGSNHTTTYSYADVYSSCGGAAPPSGATNAYLTKITEALGHTQNFCYGYDDGQLRGSTDPNRQTTTYKFNDSLRRLTETDYPDGGKTTISYNDSPYNPSTPSPSVTTTKVMTPSPNLITLTAFDGIGHTVRSALTSDPDCTSGNGDRTDTTYDGLGHVYIVSNPYCTTGDSTYGLTTYKYDALGRTTQVSEPDGSVVTTSYSGNCTTVTDEAAKSRKSCSDGLGRLTSVWEDPAGLNYQTSYTYNALDNLLSVVQNGSRQRTFNYNSLSQLTSATNPESGTITYSYDANGNLTGKTDARNVSVGYCYDALNRLACKTYSPSFAIGYYYDQPNWGSITLTNPIGRLTSAGTYDGTCWLTAFAFGYDAMGRTTFQLDSLNTAETSGCPGVSTGIYASYDLAGNQISLTYPSGRVIKSHFSGANRLTNINVDDLSGYNYLSSAHYAPFGSPTNFALGNGATEASTYNNRLQPLNQQVANTTSTLLNHTYGFNPGHNNGNVLSITDNLNSALTQNFSYDSLNRIHTAQTAGTSGPNCWGQQFGYDAWGNLLTETPNVPGCPTNMLSLGVNGNNQITNTGFSYDAAGNLLADGTNNHYTYDNENHLTSLNSGAATYTYDAEGRRMAKKIGSATTEYIYFNGDVLAEYNLGSQLWSDYIFGGRRLASAGSDDIFNPGFEQGLEGWRTWAGNSSGSEQVITDATRAHSGNKYLQLSTTTAQVWTMNETVAVNPGDQVTFGGWVYLESGSATVGWNLVVLDSNGNALGFPGIVNTSSGTWTYQSYTYTVPSGGASVALYAQIYQPTASTTVRFDDGFLTGASGLGVHYYHADHLGSARLMTDASGNQSWSATYLPFGQEWNPQATTNHYKFTGKERDSESGLDNFGARYDSSSMGRFMSPDPENAGAVNVDPQSWNGYSYALNNPINNVDPNGLATKVCIDDGNGGQNCSWYANDSDFDKGVANSSGVSAQNGNIYATVDGQQVQVGTYTRDNGAPDISSDFLNLYFAGKAVRGLFSLGRLAVSGVSNLFKGAAEEAADVAIMAKPTPAEAAMIEELRQAGNAVEQLPRTAGKSADLLVNGVKTELKTLVGEGPNTLKNAVETAAKQGEQILVDARGTNMTAEQVANQIARAQGNVGGLSGRVTVLTNNGVVKF